MVPQLQFHLYTRSLSFSPPPFPSQHALILLSAILLGELASWPPSQYVGCVLTFAGTFWYSWLRQNAKKG